MADLDPAVYERAADVLDEDGWIQGSLHSAFGWCAIGALREATGIPDCQVTPGSYLRPLENLAGGGVPGWNDRPGRTKDEVTDLFRTVAGKLRAEQGTMLDGAA